MKPFLKWAGNKYAIRERVKATLPPGQRLIEPFAGSCAVFLNTEYPEYLLGDVNADLIHLYQHLQREGEAFIEYCRSFYVPENNLADRYYALRTEFNATDDPRVRAALFLYFNRHGYNGLCRYNAKGQFNVPFGKYKQPYFPGREMRDFHEKSRNALFVVSDFSKIMLQARPGDVVYCDPPYVPLSETANFTSYSGGGFGEEEQQALADLAELLSGRGVTVVISNHDTPFTQNAYQSARIIPFEVQRFISCNGKNRGKAAEMLAVFSGPFAHPAPAAKIKA